MYCLIAYPPCSTCKAIEKQLKEKNIDYIYRDITEDVPSAQELMQWFQTSKESSIKKFINTSGVLYREENYKDQLQGLSDFEIFEKISVDGMLIKRPILITDKNEVFVGKSVKEFLDAK